MRRAFPEPSDLHPSTPTPRRAAAPPAPPPRAPEPPPGAWWNGIARAWFTGSADAPQRLDPQPAAPVVVDVPVTITARYGKDGAGNWSAVPPAVKVSA